MAERNKLKKNCNDGYMPSSAFRKHPILTSFFDPIIKCDNAVQKVQDFSWKIL
jgi:hypothetical protein